jgi:hypothetical protein
MRADPGPGSVCQLVRTLFDEQRNGRTPQGILVKLGELEGI